MLLEYSIMLLEYSIMLLESSIMLLESSITLLESPRRHSTGVTHDDCHMQNIMFIVQATGSGPKDIQMKIFWL